MSRYRPVISIRTDLVDQSIVTGASSGDPIYEAGASRVDAHSITPKTLRAVTEFDAAVITAHSGSTAGGAGGTAALAYNPELYTSIEEYSYLGNNFTLWYKSRYNHS